MYYKVSGEQIKNKFFILLSTRLSLSFHKIGCGSVKSKSKTSF